MKVLPNTGFTLIELLIVIALLAVITGASLPSYIGYQKNQTITQAIKQIKSDLRFAQRRAVSSLEGKAWGLHFVVSSPHQYELFSCNPSSTYTDYVYGEENDCPSRQIIQLNPSISLQLVSDYDIVFDVLTGKVIVGGVLLAEDLLIDVSDGTTIKRVTVTTGGAIEDYIDPNP